MLTLLLAAQLSAVEIRRLPAAEAHQGAVADTTSVYAIANSAVARYDKASGKRLAVWNGDPKRFKHLNSCIVRARHLVCAASNYPDVPQASQILWIDTATMTLVRTRPMPAGIGSLTWVDWHDGAWWAAYANYDAKGGEAGRDHRATALVRYDTAWRETGRWRFPDAVLARFAPRSSSGGLWGQDGRLYVTGHDRPELYVLKLPSKGLVLDLITTIATPTGGQAIGRDGTDPRLLWSIDRAEETLVQSRIPAIP